MRGDEDGAYRVGRALEQRLAHSDVDEAHEGLEWVGCLVDVQLALDLRWGGEATVRQCTVCGVWYGMWHGCGMVVAWYGMVWYGVVWCGMVWHGVVWHGMAWHGMVWHEPAMSARRG
jgi:hypothetical protein